MIEASIADGRNGVMPAFGQALKEQEIKDVAYYVLSLSGFPADGLKLYGGRKVFASSCAACHGPDGKGNQVIGAPNLTDKIWLHGNSPDTVIETITKGRNSHMPSHKETLDQAKIHLLAAYVYSLSKEPEQLAQHTTSPATMPHK
jgi:cytochrome c oxidase cbb3-type subunit 3